MRHRWRREHACWVVVGDVVVASLVAAPGGTVGGQVGASGVMAFLGTVFALLVLLWAVIVAAVLVQAAIG